MNKKIGFPSKTNIDIAIRTNKGEVNNIINKEKFISNNRLKKNRTAILKAK